MACGISQKRFEQISDLKVHMTSHAGENTNICDTCGKELVQKYNLRARHAGTKTARSCAECKKQFIPKNIRKPKQLTTQESDMKKPTGLNKEPMPKKKPMGSKKFVCHVCGRGYTSKYRLKRHVKKHEEKKPVLVCDLCSMEFKWEENLKIHLLCHRFEKPAIEPKSGSAIFVCETVFAEEDPCT